MTDTPNFPSDDPSDPTDPSIDDVFTDDEPTGDLPATDEPVDEEPMFNSGAMPPPPLPQPGPRRLVRDPYTRLGGVSSGIGHYFGIDVSIVRIITLLLAIGTGFGFLAYLLAWLIIPRADHWPPGGPAARPVQSMSKRDLGLGLAAVGVLTILVFGGGTAGSVLVPLVLVGGGVWLLLQPGSEGTAAVAGAGTVPPPFAGEAAFVGGTAATGGAYGPAAPAQPPSSAYLVNPPGPPVPPRSKRRVGWVAAILIGLFAIVVLIPIALISAIAIAISQGDFFEDPVVYVIDDVDDLPLVVDADGGEVTVDLRNLDPADFIEGDPLATIDVELGAGTIEVIVPEGLAVNVDANAGLGDVEVFGRNDSGPASDLSSTSSDAVVDIELDLGIGEIDVVRR